MTEPYTAKITIDVKAVSAEYANELWLEAVKLVEATSTSDGASYVPGKGQISFTVVETGRPTRPSLQREMNERMARALRGELE